MPTIQNLFDELTETFYEDNWSQKLNKLILILQNLETNNSIFTLAFILELQNNPLEIPKFSKEMFKFTFLKIQEKLKSLLPKECIHLIEQNTKQEFRYPTNKITKEESGIEYLTSIVTECLIVSSTKEIENLVNIFFEKNDFCVPLKILNYYLKAIEDTKNINCLDLQLIFKSLQSNEVSDYLEHLENSNLKKELILFAYFFNEKFYNEIFKYVVNMQISKFYEFLPVIKEDLIEKEKLDFNFLLKIMNERPALFDKLIFLVDFYDIETYKSEIVQTVSNNLNFWSKRIQIFKFTFEDFLKIAEINEDFLINMLCNLKDFENILYSEITKLFLKVGEEKQIEIFKILINNQNLHTKLLIQNYIETGSLSEKLKEFFLENLSEEYFYSLLPFFKKEKQLESLGKYLKDSNSLNYFLKVFTLGELFYFSHYISNVEQSKIAIQLCIDHPKFNETVLNFAIPKMETDKLPVLFMRTMIICFLKLKNCKKKFVNLMVRLQKKDIFKDNTIYQGYIKFLELMEEDAMEVLKQLDSDKLYSVLKGNRRICNECKRYFQNNDVGKDRQLLLVKTLLNNIRH